MANKVSYTFVLTDKISAAARKIGTSTERVRKKFRGLKIDADRLSKGLKRAGTAMRGVSTGAALLIAGAVKSFGDLEQGIFNVLTLLDDDAAVLKFRDRIDELAKSAIKAGFGTKDATKALFDAVSALGAGEEAFGAFETAQKLAIAGVTELSIATDGITSIMNAYGSEVKNADEVANAFFTAQKKGKTTVAALAANIGKVAPVAKAAGVGYKELLAVTAQLTLGGLSTEESTTALRGAIAALIKPTTSAARVLRAIGAPVGAAELKAVGLTETLSKLAEISEKYPDALVAAIPDIRAFTAAASLGREELANVDVIVRRINQDIAEGTGLNDAFTKQQRTFNQEMSRTFGAVKVLAAMIGEALAPVVKLVGAGIRGLIAVFEAMNPVVRTVAATILSIVAVAAPVLLLFGKLKVVVVAIGAVAAAVGAPILFVLAGIAAAIVIIIAKWESLKKIFTAPGLFGKLGAFKEFVFGVDTESVKNLALDTSAIDVSGIVPGVAKSKTTVDINVRAKEGLVELIKSKTIGDATDTKIGINMAEAG